MAETLDAMRRLAPEIPVILSCGCTQAEVFAGDNPELPQVFLGKPYCLKELREATLKGNHYCCQMNDGSCNQTDCCWRKKIWSELKKKRVIKLCVPNFLFVSNQRSLTINSLVVERLCKAT